MNPLGWFDAYRHAFLCRMVPIKYCDGFNVERCGLLATNKQAEWLLSVAGREVGDKTVESAKPGRRE